MFLPIQDEAPIRRLDRPRVTWSIIALNCLLFLVLQSGSFGEHEPNVSLGFGLIPSVFFGIDQLDAHILRAPAVLTPLTSLFLHGGWLHLLGNMLFLWVFADNVEDEMGHGRFLLFYLLTGIIAGLGYALTAQGSQSPLIGASGAVAGILGAYMVLHPRVTVFGLFLNVVPIRIPAVWFIGGWFAFQIGHALFDPNRAVAWTAHVFGLIAGAALVFVFRMRPVPKLPVHRNRH